MLVLWNVLVVLHEIVVSIYICVFGQWFRKSKCKLHNYLEYDKVSSNSDLLIYLHKSNYIVPYIAHLYSWSKVTAWQLGFGFSTFRPSQKPSQAITLAQLDPPYLGLAWPSSWPEARPSTALFIKTIWGLHELCRESVRTCQEILHPNLSEPVKDSVRTSEGILTQFVHIYLWPWIINVSKSMSCSESQKLKSIGNY